MSVYKSLANFWLFIHKWKEITEKLTKDLESHSKIADQKEQKVNTEEEKEAMAAETVKFIINFFPLFVFLKYLKLFLFCTSLILSVFFYCSSINFFRVIMVSLFLISHG